MADGRIPASAKTTFHRRGFIVFVIALGALILLVSGLVLFIAPNGRIALATHWTFLWLDKDRWFNLHNVFAILLIVGFLFHLIFNWKPFCNYVVSRATHHLNLKREMVVAVLAIVVLVALAAWNIPPISVITDIRDFFRHEFWITMKI